MSDSTFWNEDWMKTQQKYWENWTDMSRKAMGLEKPAKSPLESAMEHWWQGVSPGTTDFNQDFMNKMMEQSRGFFRMAESYYQNAGESQNWLDAANRTINDLQQMFSGNLENVFSGAENAGDDALHKMMAFWEMPFDNWQRMVSSLSLVPGDLLRNMPHNDGMERFLSAPGLGYMREEEGQYKKLMRRVVVYQRALADYMRFFSNLGLLSANRLREKVQGLVEEGKQIDSARGLYDLWVSSSEEVYGEQVMTPEYAKIHGKLVNALMAVKQKLSHLVDESLGGLNMPTRRELRTLQDRLQDSRREYKALKAEVELLKEQIMELRKPVPEKSKSSQASTAAKKPAKKKVSKKKAAAKSG
ncbi:MAG: class III poly(R)-hydroxyalkanoic acid synthase subunit PhaE [Candidatus Thiodiazotropha sp. (ex Ctena orbiculata)]|nr:class III poly(R)-hydroxyalkanoic acid synthase subunit PhaE [Candidatus Thiodiazotropha taylori]MBT3036584.1 class III poly(R)-hydroxyalkanoic acid synthase subunit PhaE [Candidatus Thiodiazotropha taylori]PUB82158.1 MAG: class III poly(R)-hydroxyalkanoic acid synthase subunit PhaE [gamma proteobacterium symbiont of Ctena orbiculata]